MFGKLCNVNLKTHFENPYGKSQKVFVLFDTVALIQVNT